MMTVSEVTNMNGKCKKSKWRNNKLNVNVFSKELLLNILMLSFAIFPTWATETDITKEVTKSEFLSVKFEQEHLSLRAKDVPLGKIITEIEKKITLNILINENLKEKPVTINFSKLNILKALEAIKGAAGLGGYVVVYEPSTNAHGKRDRDVGKVMIVQQGTMEGHSLKATKENDVLAPNKTKKGMKVRLLLHVSAGGLISRPLVKTPSLSHSVTVTEHRKVPEAPPRQRNPELSSQQLVIKALDSKGQEITRVDVADPRLVRTQTVEPSGTIKCEVFYQDSVEFTVVLPDDPDITQLKIYHPHWTGTEFILEPIGETQLL
jgi:hypothetical protein